MMIRWRGRYLHSFVPIHFPLDLIPSSFFSSSSFSSFFFSFLLLCFLGSFSSQFRFDILFLGCDCIYSSSPSSRRSSARNLCTRFSPRWSSSRNRVGGHRKGAQLTKTNGQKEKNKPSGMDHSLPSFSQEMMTMLYMHQGGTRTLSGVKYHWTDRSSGQSEFLCSFLLSFSLSLLSFFSFSSQ